MTHPTFNRRGFIKTGAIAGVGTLALGTGACEKKDVDFYIATVTGALTQLKPLLPAQAALLDKAISIAKSINQAYQDGKFDDALGLANNLVATINEVIAAAGVNLTDTVKMILSIASVVLSTIAVLIEASRPTNRPAAPGAPASGTVRSLASPERVNAIFEASRPR